MATPRRSVLGALVITAVLTSPPAAASAQDGYMFGHPIATFGLRVGAALPHAQDRVHEFFTRELTLDRKDFASATLGADLAIWLNSRLDLVVNVSTAGVSRQSEFRDWVDANDEAIEQDTKLRRTPLSAGARFFLVDRGRSVGKLAWVPTSVAPYVGAGAGVTWYSLKQNGDFIDHETLDIFSDTFESSGSTEQVHAFAGVEWWARPLLGVTIEGRYAWGSAPLDDGFRDFDSIDLRGFQLTVGLATRFGGVR